MESGDVVVTGDLRETWSPKSLKKFQGKYYSFYSTTFIYLLL